MKYGLIGKTLIHSYSKEIHEALGEYQYELFSLSADEMPEFIAAHDFDGLNVTIPYKQAVMSLCDEVSQLAKDIGAVNTLYWSRENDDSCENTYSHPMGNGGGCTGRQKLIGHNTDYEGFIYAAERAKIDFTNKTVLILGSGGTSLMARKAASDMGAAQVFIASRSCNVSANNTDKTTKTIRKENLNDGIEGEKSSNNSATNTSYSSPAHDICNTTMLPLGATAASIETTISYEALPAIADTIDIAVNTTPVGTFPNNLARLISLKDFPSCSAVMDVIYNPFKTALLLEAEKLGLKFSNGLPMLVAQATAAAGYFLYTPGVFYDENERIIRQMEERMRNIVLIGMPGSGKSTIGKLLAKETGKVFVDMDDEIVNVAAMSIPEIFAKEGENGFRTRESKIATELGKQHGQIIATGGGAILRAENVDALRQNGLIIHILRPAESLPTGGRPLSTDISTLKEMEKKRLPLYEAAADITFDNSRAMTKSDLKSAVYSTLFPSLIS